MDAPKPKIKPNESRPPASGDNLPILLIGLFGLLSGTGILLMFGYALFKQFEDSHFLTFPRHGAGTAELIGSTPSLSPGEAIFQSCIPCHGPNAEGSIVMLAPALNKQDPGYLYRQIINFKEGKRGAHPLDTKGAQMHNMMTTLKDEASILSVIDHITSLSSPLPERTFTADIEKGRSSFALCIACHGTDAIGKPELKTPTLVGLQDWYIVNTLTKFKGGLRGYDASDHEGLQMRPWAMGILNEEEMKNIAAYIHSLNDDGRALSTKTPHDGGRLDEPPLPNP